MIQFSDNCIAPSSMKLGSPTTFSEKMRKLKILLALKAVLGMAPGEVACLQMPGRVLGYLALMRWLALGSFRRTIQIIMQ